MRTCTKALLASCAALTLTTFAPLTAQAQKPPDASEPTLYPASLVSPVGPLLEDLGPTFALAARRLMHDDLMLDLRDGL